MASSQILYYRNWAALPNELLESISKKLTSVLDYVRFCAVCPSWRSTAKVIRFPPLLMLPSDHNSDTLSFYNIFEKVVENIQVPEARNKVFCGSSYGWLFLMDEAGSTSLLNPFTHVQIQLPPVDAGMALASGKEVSMVDGRYVRNRESDLGPISLMEMRETFIKKTLLSSDPGSGDSACIVMAILASSRMVALCKPGDERWILLDSDLPCDLESMVYCNRRFYLIGGGGTLSVCVAGPPAKASKVQSLSFDILRFSQAHYFAEYNKTLFLAIKNRRSKTEHLEFYRAEIWQKPWWSKVEKINDCMFFLSKFYSSYLIPNQLYECKDAVWDYISKASHARSRNESEANHLVAMDVNERLPQVALCWHLPNRDEASWVTPNLFVGTIHLGGNI